MKHQNCGTSFSLNGLERGDNFKHANAHKLGSGYLLVNTNTEIHGMINEDPGGCS